MIDQEQFERDARDFLRRIDAQRNERNAQNFRGTTAKVTETTTVVAVPEAKPEARVDEVTVFTPNSNAQGI